MKIDPPIHAAEPGFGATRVQAGPQRARGGGPIRWTGGPVVHADGRYFYLALSGSVPFHQATGTAGMVRQ